MLNLRPRVCASATGDSVALDGLVGTVPKRRYDYRTFSAPDPNPATSPPDSPLGFSTCETCGALYVNDLPGL